MDQRNIFNASQLLVFGFFFFFLAITDCDQLAKYEFCLNTENYEISQKIMLER